jgi:hypothetical protein
VLAQIGKKKKKKNPKKLNFRLPIAIQSMPHTHLSSEASTIGTFEATAPLIFTPCSKFAYIFITRQLNSGRSYDTKIAT